MILGIDASNLRAGGGVTHLVEVLRAAKPSDHGFSKVIVWSGTATLSRIEDRPWMIKSRQAVLDKSLLHRVFWQKYRLSRLARESGCDALFVPGGSYSGDFHPIVSMSRNMLPFEWVELKRYGLSWATIRLLLLRWTQTLTFRNADGLIFLTNYAKQQVMGIIRATKARTAIIPHGIDNRFSGPPRKQLSIRDYSVDRPYRILYVSIIDLYKHQWHVVEGVARLRSAGYPVALDLVGPGTAVAMRLLQSAIERHDPNQQYVRYRGEIPHNTLHTLYASADMCLFASSCENLPNILLEGMASGLPVVCSDRGPMSEVLGAAGAYFDPEQPIEIAAAIEKLLDDPDLRYRLAGESHGRAQDYSWERCANETLAFIAGRVSNKF
ncbi:MAG: glycosyltransferase [Gammaproteobacteria bacterium]|nr:MAG: glycosyltransferase [Gammaproteobacteria bacterium]TND07025.1 MAG: glycosyltransferase [Gammaproteobacteria bacterium]